MLVLSFKMTKARLAAFVIVCVMIIAVVTAIADNQGSMQAVSKVNNDAATNEQRLAFLSSFGWQVNSEPAEIIEVIIPTEFDSVYEKYNAIQKVQGYDLTKQKGKRVKRYTYTVTNYPTPQESPINANLLVYNDKIIGGDICSTALGGFIHGVNMPS